MYQRIYKIEDEPEESLFLFGARQTGKTTLIRQRFPKAVFIDLLQSDIYTRLQNNPERLRQQIQTMPHGTTVIIDEIQQLPVLLNEIHWLISNCGTRFILCGSSARKLKRRGVNTLGGRALLNKLYPLVYAEIPDFDLIRAINNGMIPSHYLASERMIHKKLQAYISVYLKEEIKAEALRSIGFSKPPPSPTAKW